MITWYQNLIKICYWQKAGGKKQKVVTQNQKFITKNQRIEVITRYQNLIKICYWQKVVKKTPQKVVILNKDLIIKTKKGNYSVSEPHRQE